MSKKLIPTFRSGQVLLTGAAAKTAWAEQSARCNCGYHGDADESIGGTAGDLPAEWLGCPNCDGQALGSPLVYRTASEIAAC